jgi:pimeloyl-ACP methyl ester carboxylesterase
MTFRGIPGPTRPWLAPALHGLVLLLAPLSPELAAASPLQVTHKTLKSGKGMTIAAESGTLAVPENRSVAGSRTIAIRFLRLKSGSATARAPIFYLAGGPGNRGVSESPRTLDFWSPLLEVADVVLIDQRGTNDPDLVWHWDGPPPLSFFVNADSARGHIDRMSRRALSVFRERGVDVTGYNTVASAEDIDALRAALGLERISLLAFSYGTHLAAAYLRHYGEHVESAVMIGTEGPDDTLKPPWSMDVQFEKLARLVAQDPRIGATVPDLVALYDRVVARLAREPMIIPLETGPGDTLHVPVGPFGLRLFLRADVGDASDLPVFPRLLWSIDQGDPSVLSWFLNKRAGVALGVPAMTFATDAASGASPARLAMIEAQSRTSRFADVINVPPAEATATWGIPDLGEDFRAPLVSTVRTLFISGSLDFNAPPYQAEHMRWGMPNATHLVVENAGHEQTFFQNDGARAVIADFLAGRDVHGRTITYPPLRFIPLEGSDPVVSHPSVR